MAFMSCSGNGDHDEAAEKFAGLFGPQQIDQFIRQAVQYCWMCLPKERRTPDEVEAQIRRLVDRALKDFRDDQAAFST